MSKIFLNDWRINGQEDYLMSKELIKSIYSKETGHEHCIFCWHKFMKYPDGIENCSGEGYCTPDGKYWICDKCFNDFKEDFNWKLI